MSWRSQITSAAKNFQLGYNIQKPYPWRGTTPLVCIFFVGLTMLLVFVNIPLSAYDVVQEFTYTPNDTSPSLPFSSVVPASLRHTAGDFTPQTFKIGDTIQSNLSAFNYVITDAFTDSSLTYPVGSFPYYNNPLSSCDVSNISLSLRKEERASLSAVIYCWFPVYYRMTLSLNHASMQDRTFHILNAVPDLDGLLTDAECGWDSENVTLVNDNGDSGPTSNQNVTGLDVSVYPCCNCADNGLYYESYIKSVVAGQPWLVSILIDHPPCDGDVAKFQGTWTTAYYGQGAFFDFTGGGGLFGPGANILPPNDVLEVPSNVQLVVQNAFQAIYHTIRLDLGVIRPNQIFTSPNVFSESISAVPLYKPSNMTFDRDDTGQPAVVLGGISRCIASWVVNNSYANASRQAHFTNDFLNFYYQQALQFGPFDVRVPSVSYLRPVFRRKSTASAISSVFVATFAMVSAAWSLFNFIAGTFCKGQSVVVRIAAIIIEILAEILSLCYWYHAAIAAMKR
ncbi:uncharacterized protein BT62DRAFT_1003637 [Guyanagaster necrorhizus]|uniref:Transmembrane protein n=1 Tax=Guyanagaster necrorhizus TaxID=856835 RepID=A0A9P7VYJ3_9AGAR|nr:uncharacterized protein BT62DRAFT_1003637 [Guyanagaster necrorhizus MCA 3950]KAG7448917.1 hypothetical protein BT62DRAFT_1003637 [Guyanagaster necrorhizus MCA 3950]